jgi:hypothetical protein
MDIYWSTIYPMEVYADYNMLYKEPQPLIKELLPERGPDNPHDFFACPAFHLHAANTFVVRSALGANVAVGPEGFAPLDERSELTVQLFSFLHPTRRGYRSILFDHRMLFFSERPVVLATYPAFMHHTEVQSKLDYVPAAYDISKWLRPVQGTYEVPEDVTALRIREDDPLYYVKFETNEKVRLRRFQMVPELHGMAHGCVHYKLFRPRSSLERVYAAFTQAKLDRRATKLIKANLLD